MPLRFSKFLMKPRSFQRGIASFFLIFTFIDMVYIDLLGQRSCSEEAAVLPTVRTASIESEESQKNEASIMAYTHTDFTNQSTHPDNQRPEGALDEDCFCCCSHLIPSISVDISVLNNSPQPGDPAMLFIPSSPPRSTFHPPRLS